MSCQIIQHCPSCNATFKVGSSVFGKAVKCSRCNTTFRIAEVQYQADPVPPPVYSSAHSNLYVTKLTNRWNEADRKKLRKLAWIIGPALLLLIGVGVRLYARNAKCPACGCRFTIPDLRERGGLLQFRMDYECPDCLIRFPAAVLYNYQDGSSGRAQKELDDITNDIFNPSMKHLKK